MLVDRKVDLAAIMVADGPRFATRQAAGIVTVPWGTAPLVGAFPPRMERELASVVGLEFFHGAIVVLPHRTLAVPSLPEVVEEAFDTHGIVPAEIRRVETIQTSIPLIQAGMAMSILPDPDNASLGSTGLALRMLEPAIPSLDVIVLVRGGDDPSPTLERSLRRIRAV
jgi:DNA-binding transcriptional LysR family regulator